MPYKSEKIKLSETQDRRRKLTSEDYEIIKKKYSTGYYSLRSLAREYNVSHSLILLIVNPTSAERNRQYIKEHWKNYVASKEENARQKRDTRHYKQSLYLKGELIDIKGD